MIFVEAKGIEPLLEEPKSSVLPLDDASMNKSIQGKPKKKNTNMKSIAMQTTQITI